MKWTEKEPQAGDIVRVKAGVYYHYGIYIGGDEVIEFGGPDNVSLDPASIKVIKAPVSEFLVPGGMLETGEPSISERLRRRSRRDTVAAANASLGEGGYSLFNNNCLHFAERCYFSK